MLGEERRRAEKQLSKVNVGGRGWWVGGGRYERIAMKVRLRRPCQYLTFYFAYVPAKTTHQDARLTSVLTGLGKGFPMMNPK